MSAFLAPENALSMYRGTSKTLQVAVKDDSGAVVDITGAHLYFTLKKDVRDTQPVVQKVSTDVAQIEFTAPRSGVARIYIVPADTQTLDTGIYTFDVLLVLPSGKRYLVVPPTEFELMATVSVVPLS